jgi:hypothetical protein
MKTGTTLLSLALLAGSTSAQEALKHHRLAAAVRHLDQPERKVCGLTMEGLFFEVEIASLEARQLFNLVDELNLPSDSQPHFKSAHTAQESHGIHG